VRTRGPRKLCVLAIGAHPDDIELGCGGVILELVKRGHEVHALVVTDGCGGENRDPPTREKEANDAAKVLGISSVEFGGIRDGHAHMTSNLFNLVKGQIDRHHPDFVLFHAGIGSEHTDHKNISETVRTVIARMTTALRGLMYEGPTYAADPSFQPRMYVNIGESLETKKEAINQHTSEIDRGTISLDHVEQRARHRSAEVGPDILYAEAFEIYPTDSDVSHMLRLLPFAIAK
jgi:LmbE family N-acetylglucosaminyl deacetylase